MSEIVRPGEGSPTAVDLDWPHAVLLRALNAYRADREVPRGESMVISSTTQLPSFFHSWLIENGYEIRKRGDAA